MDGAAAAALSSGLRIRLVPGSRNQSILESFLQDPGGFLTRGTVYKPGSRGFAVAAEIGGHFCFIKHYRSRGWGYRLRNLFRRSRAMRTWEVSRCLLQRGVPVPVPLFCIEERRFRLLGEAYLVTDFIAGALDLQQFWAGASEAQRTAILLKSARILGKMHAAGCRHGDLKWNNVLVKGGEESAEIVLVDVDAASCRPRLRRRQAESDLQRFLDDLHKVDASGNRREIFLAEWKRCLSTA